MARRSDPEDVAKVERILDRTLRDPEWVAKAETDCRPGIRGFCGNNDCAKCAPVRARIREKADEQRNDD